MRVLFRTDCDASQGMGHVMRCATLARVFEDAGARVAFACAKPDGVAFVVSNGFALLDLAGHGADSELTVLSKYAAGGEVDLIVADSYELSVDYLSALDSIAPTAYIDDLHTGELAVSAIVNGNVTSDKGRYREMYPSGIPMLLIGTEYALLRDEFRGLPEPKLRRHPRKVFVSSGGSDPYSASVRIIEVLLSSPLLDEVSFVVMAGPLSGSIEELQRFAERDARVSVLRGVKNVSALMTSCDIAIAAAGGTLNELCACGVPSIAYALAENQLGAVESFADVFAALPCGAIWDESFTGRLTAAVELLVSSPMRRRELSCNARKLFDGKGAERTVERLVDIAGTIRKRDLEQNLFGSVSSRIGHSDR